MKIEKFISNYSETMQEKQNRPIAKSALKENLSVIDESSSQQSQLSDSQFNSDNLSNN